MDLVAVLVLGVTAWVPILCTVIAMCSLAGRADALDELLNAALADRRSRRAVSL
jgi:hypothetical protein